MSRSPATDGSTTKPANRPRTRIYVDADACPTKEEVFRVARRLELSVIVVANTPVRTPEDVLIEAVIVGAGDDVADDWIAAEVRRGDIVVTADIPLAARCLAAGARALDPRGREFTEDSIGTALAGRELSRHLRELGIHAGGPRPLEKKDRSRFLNTLDAIVRSIGRDQS